MHKQMLVLVVPLLAALACSGRAAPESASAGDRPATKTEVTDVKTTTPPKSDAAGKGDPCGAAALGLAEARALEAWTPPPGCSPRGQGTAILRSDADLAPRIECTAGMNHLVDFTKHALLAVGHTVSPAGAGVVAFDDGKVVTRVTRQRASSPGEPVPMPYDATAWFLLPVGAERTFADKTCTVESTTR